MSPSNDFDHDVEEMARRLRQHDGVAFAWLYEQFHRLVISKLRREFKNDEEVEDLSQLLWLKLHQSWPHAPTEQPFRPWLLTVLRHVVIDHLRKRKPHSVELDADRIPAVDSVDLASEHERRTLFRRCCEKLAAEEKMILEGKLAGKSSILIGDEARRPPATIDAMFHRIKGKLRQCVQGGAK